MTILLLLAAVVRADEPATAAAAPQATEPAAQTTDPASGATASSPAAPASAASPAAPASVAPAIPAVPAQYECTSFPVRSTTVMGPFQAPADVSGARVNATRLPVGWQPVGGSLGDGGAFVLACRVVGS